MRFFSIWAMFALLVFTHASAEDEWLTKEFGDTGYKITYNLNNYNVGKSIDFPLTISSDDCSETFDKSKFENVEQDRDLKFVKVIEVNLLNSLCGFGEEGIRLYIYNEVLESFINNHAIKKEKSVYARLVSDQALEDGLFYYNISDHEAGKFNILLSRFTKIKSPLD